MGDTLWTIWLVFGAMLSLFIVPFTLKYDSSLTELVWFIEGVWMSSIYYLMFCQMEEVSEGG